MRVSSNKSDPGYRPDLIGRVIIYLGNRRVAQCITADEELGEVHVHAQDEKGNCVMRDGEFVIVVYKGTVRIIVPEKIGENHGLS